MATKLGSVPPSTVKSWHRKRVIPSWRHAEILSTAKRLGIGLAPEELTSVRADEEAQPATA